MVEPVLPKLRERLKEVRERLPRLRGEKARAEIQIGKGALIEKLRERATRTTERIQEIKPGIVPKIGEILSQWYPGKRLVTVVTPKTEIVRPGEITLTEPRERYEPRKEEEGMHY